MNVYNTAVIRFDSISANEGFARATAACFAAQLDPTLEELSDVKTTVSEAVTNAIVHGYPDCIGTITMRLRLLEGRILEIRISDRGIGIPNVEEARQPLFTTGGSDRSGMGFTIMESFSDSITVRSTPGRGTVVTLKKHFTDRRGAGR